MQDGREVGIEGNKDIRYNIVIVYFRKNTSAKEQLICRRTVTKNISE
jgi:hypothetical protein